MKWGGQRIAGRAGCKVVTEATDVSKDQTHKESRSCLEGSREPWKALRR